MGEALSKKQGQWFSTDRPIERRADDRLGRRGFAEAIASAVRGWRGRDSLVIALYGVWGTGKSSVKNMVIEALKERKTEDVLVAQFNSWQFANREQLTAFAGQRNALVSMFRLTAVGRLDGAGAQTHAEVLLALLQCWGDEEFSKALGSESSAVQHRVVEQLRYATDEDKTIRSTFPRTFRLWSPTKSLTRAVSGKVRNDQMVTPSGSWPVG